LNHKKKKVKQDKKVRINVCAVRALFMTEYTVKNTNAIPPKHRVIRIVSLKVMGTFFSGRRNENGHHIKSLSVSQL
jgi:hypothetical protein